MRYVREMDTEIPLLIPVTASGKKIKWQIMMKEDVDALRTRLNSHTNYLTMRLSTEILYATKSTTILALQAAYFKFLDEAQLLQLLEPMKDWGLSFKSSKKLISTFKECGPT
jgi:hypothetical protein